MIGYTPSEASILTGLPLTAVRRALEDDAVPSQSIRAGHLVRRVISQEGLLCLKLEQLGVGGLPPAYRKRIYAAILAQPGLSRWKESEAILIEVRRARMDLKNAITGDKKACAMVVSAPGIMGGDLINRVIEIDLVEDKVIVTEFETS